LQKFNRKNVFLTWNRIAHFSPQDVVCPEAVKLDDIDPAAVASQYEKAKSAFNNAASGSLESAEAQVEMEVNKAMGLAIGVSLS